MSEVFENMENYDFNKICRTCLSVNNTVSLNKKCSNGVQLVEMFKTLTSKECNENDKLPFQVCVRCQKKIINAYTFVKNSIEIENKLKKCIELRENDDIIEIKQSDSVQETTVIIEPIYEFLKEEICEYEIIETSEATDLIKNNDFENSNKTDVKQSIKTYECKKCNEMFPNFQSLKLHRLEKKHNTSKHARKICEICSKSISYSKMNEHKRTHTLEKPYCCNVCGAKFSISGNLKRHMNARHSSEKPYKCDKCDKGYTRLGILKEHQKIHTDEITFKSKKSPNKSRDSKEGDIKYPCHYCGEIFSKYTLKRHIFVSHEKGISEHQCDVCQRYYPSKILLKAHYVTHGEKKFLCSVCGKGFISLVLLNSHSKVHTGIRPYKCDICSKTFSHIGSLKTHSLIHTGQKPHICDICYRSFTQKSHLRGHLRIHSGEKPYSCTFCGKTFALKSNLIVHKRIHTGETPYICFCGKGFHDSSSLKKHNKGHIKTEKEEN